MLNYPFNTFLKILGHPKGFGEGPRGATGRAGTQPLPFLHSDDTFYRTLMFCIS